MGRRKKYTGPTRAFTSEQDEKRLEETLDRIEDLCGHFDVGYKSYALLLAIDVFKALDEGRAARLRRSKGKFPSPASEDDPKNLAAYFPLTYVFLGQEDGTFEPLISAGAPDGWKELDFNKWWREPVYRANAGGAGSPGIPVNDQPVLAFEKRERLTRENVIKLMRDKAGAHHSDNYPKILDEFDDPKSWGGFGVQTQDGRHLSTEDGTLPWKVGQLAACVREIAGELLVAYGRRNLPADLDMNVPPEDQRPGTRIYNMRLELVEPDSDGALNQTVPTNIHAGPAFWGH